jgi:hypothetical protein
MAAHCVVYNVEEIQWESVSDGHPLDPTQNHLFFENLSQNIFQKQTSTLKV